jgi:hypothetical protein
MKIAYLITAYGDFDHLERLVDALDEAGVGFFIHIDAKSAVPPVVIERLAARENVVFAPRREIWWGGWSHTAAILALMTLAAGQSDGDISSVYDYFIILSGTDYPVRSNSTIRETLAVGGEFINAAPGFRPGKPESRVRYYWFDGFDRRRLTSPRTWLMRGAEIALRTLGIAKRRYPFEEIWSGVVWSALSGDCVRYILEYVRTHPRFFSFFRTAQVPEEMFFQTIIGNSPFASGIRGTLTYMDWAHRSASPPVITYEHLSRLASGTTHHNPTCDRTYERLFARKFNDASGPILDYIDRNWRS